MPEPIGRHLFADLSGCPFDVLNSPELLGLAACSAAEAAGATILQVSEHQFSPHGVTLVLLLAESHLSIHTWPESGHAAVDVFTCGSSTDPEQAVAILAVKLEAESATVGQVDRFQQVA